MEWLNPRSTNTYYLKIVFRLGSWYGTVLCLYLSVEVLYVLLVSRKLLYGTNSYLEEIFYD
jgi:hypothetical protein